MKSQKALNILDVDPREEEIQPDAHQVLHKFLAARTDLFAEFWGGCLCPASRLLLWVMNAKKPICPAHASYSTFGDHDDRANARSCNHRFKTVPDQTNLRQ